MKRRHGKVRREPPEPPEAVAPDDAALLEGWAGAIEPAEELPEDVLGLLDGSARGPDADRARRRLVDEPALARAVGDFVASWRGVDPRTVDPGPPGTLITEVLDRVPASVSHDRPGRFERLVEWARATVTPGLATVAAGVLLVTFVVRDRAPTPPVDALRTDSVAPAALLPISPAAGDAVTGPIDFRWQEVAQAVRYRVVLVDADDGTVIVVGSTEAQELSVPASFLTGRFGSTAPRSFHWMVRARLIDGREVSSEPWRLTWSAH